MRKPMGDQTNGVSRRALLSTGWGAVAAAHLIGMPRLARAASGGRSVVCIYLMGGSDGNSLIAPLNSGQYDAYAASRGALAIPQSNLLPVQTRTGGTPYGLHPALGEMQQLFNNGAMAVVANVGSQTRMSSKTPGGAGAAPDVRYSSLTFVTDGYATLRWAASKAGVSGVDRNQTYTFPGGVTMLSLTGGGAIGESRQRNQDLIRFAESAAGRMAFPDTPVGRQLRTVAGLMQRGGSSAGEVYFVPVAGTNTSVQEMSQMTGVLRQLSQGMAAFYEATLSLGLSRQVVTFTDSEFGRTLGANSQQGSNPGWGNHQLVLGAAVKGGEVYGTFPEISAAGLDSDGSLIPTTSADRYHGTLASWLGVPDGEVRRLFPGLAGDAGWRMGFV
jgi:uncharacterized protein (DUF1501 family)